MKNLLNYTLLGSALAGNVLAADNLGSGAQNAQQVYQTVQARVPIGKIIDGFKIKDYQMNQGSNTYYLATFDVITNGAKFLQISVQRGKNDRIIFTDKGLDGTLDSVFLHVEDLKNTNGIRPGRLPLTEYLQKSYTGALSNTVQVLDQQQK